MLCDGHTQGGPWCFDDPEKSLQWGKDVEKCYTLSPSSDLVYFNEAQEICSLCDGEGVFDSHLIEAWDYPFDLKINL